MHTLHFAIIGCGRIAGHHARSIQAVPGLRLTAVCDLDIGKAEVYARENAAIAYDNYHTMLRTHPEIDVVVIATPSGMHFEHARDLLVRYRKSLIVEKPTFLRPGDFTEIAQLAAASGARIFPVFQNRFNLAVRRARTAIESGELGALRLFSVRVRWCRPQRYYDLSEWRGTFSQDGGALTNQGIHHVDLIRFLGGEVQSVSCEMGTFGAQIEVEDTAVATMKFAGGALGTLEVTTSARPDDFEASISMVCEKGLLQIGGIAVNELQIYTPDPGATRSFSEDFAGNVYGHGHRVIYEAIHEEMQSGKIGKAFPVSLIDARRTIELLHAFYRSAERREPVTVATGEASTRLGQPDLKLAGLYTTSLSPASESPDSGKWAANA